MITRKEHLALYSGATEEGRNAAHVAYYRQFVTPAVKERLARFLQSGGDMGNLRQMERMVVPAPADVARLMIEAGDYATLSGLVCTYRVAYDDLQASITRKEDE